MNYFIHHRRGVCHTNYSKLKPNNYNNQKCIVLGAKNKGELSHDDITFNDKTWLENSCDLQGINHISLTMDTVAEETAYVSKIKYFYDYLLNCDYEYVMVSDSTDCIIFKNPDEAISLLDEYKCDILYGVSRFHDWVDFTMPERDTFNKSINGQYSANTGVCIAKTSELLKLYKRVLEYADFNVSWLDYFKIYRSTNGYAKWSKEQLSAFPKGVSCDQVIIKYLFKDFYPKLKLDTLGLLTNKR